MSTLLLAVLASTAPALSATPVPEVHDAAVDLVLGVPVPDHPLLWERYERLVATAGGRAHVRASLERYQDHRRLVHRVLADHDVPDALAAVPVVESGYRNLDASHNPVGAAGLWQFIPSTARAYHLRVDGRIDDRLDVRRETEAAAHLLSDLHDRYGDWALALSAYNQGSARVDAAIAAHDTADPWVLMETGALPPYAADVLAAAVVLQDPTPVR